MGAGIKRAAIVVDILNAFCAGGGLAVPGGEEVVPVANKIIDNAVKNGEEAIFIQDWHPANHGSFFTMHEGKKPFELIDLNGLPQVLWTVHAVQNTPDAEFHKDLHRPAGSKVIQKGMDPKVDSYSGFFDNGDRNDTGLNTYLKLNGITHLDIFGLATEYCVKFTVLHALKLGYQVRVVVDACRGVNMNPDDSTKAIEEMRAAGAQIVTSAELV